MATSERIAAVAGKLSRLKSRHNDLAEEISELQDELHELKRDGGKKGAVKTQPAKTRPAPGHADELEEGAEDDADDDSDNDDDGDDDDGEDDEELPARARSRRR